jgi:aspartyl-tRNA(Asn)/glutamyl-tRNA(Gln) amidotransferase subunit C
LPQYGNLFRSLSTAAKRFLSFDRPIGFGKLKQDDECVFCTEKNGTTNVMREKITQNEVRHVARLAKLELLDQEEKLMTEQINDILSYMDKLNELDTANVLPTTHAIQLINIFRNDEVEPSLDREEALANAPQSDGSSFIVPKVL